MHRRLGDWLIRSAEIDVRRLREALAHRHAAGLPSVDVADRLVRSPQRTLLGEDGLALLVEIADESEPSDESVLLLNEQIAELASELARHDVALERNLLLAERWPDSLRRARALLDAARSAFALDDLDRASGYLDRARATHAGDELLDLEFEVQQAALDLWGAGPKERGRALAHEAAVRGRRLYESGGRARRPYLEALRVEYEAAFQEDDLEAMARAADERAEVARGFDEAAHLTGLIASGRALQRRGPPRRGVGADPLRLGRSRTPRPAAPYARCRLLARRPLAPARPVSRSGRDCHRDGRSRRTRRRRGARAAPGRAGCERGRLPPRRVARRR